MRTDFSGALIPQAAEDITKAEWVSPEKVKDYFPNMYPLIQEIIKTELS
jgi:mRNA-degrading endonuclease HigB of HigAB toxin-antitoxin module